MLSAISYIACPAEAYNHGMTMSLKSVFVILGIPPAIYLFVRFFRRLSINNSLRISGKTFRCFGPFNCGRSVSDAEKLSFRSRPFCLSGCASACYRLACVVQRASCRNYFNRLYNNGWNQLCHMDRRITIFRSRRRCNWSSFAQLYSPTQSVRSKSGILPKNTDTPIMLWAT